MSCRTALQKTWRLKSYMSGREDWTSSWKRNPLRPMKYTKTIFYLESPQTKNVWKTEDRYFDYC